ncbi:MAG: hypothetical protein JWO80_3611 [Bryobacterales bacterium]|nr:hypothetical protein [Bryobacterales bacterium]
MLTYLAATVRFSLAASLAIACFGADSVSWNRTSAAAYLDGRADWWMTWPNAARDHGTFCISCHTAAPYALSRLSLRAALQENGPSAPERKLLDNVTKRVRMWADVEPFYKDGKSGPTKSAESRGTESVLNALILATYDAREGKLSDDAKTAFQNMWALQEKTGAWTWLDFHNKPWEAGDSQYYGAALAALAVGKAPESYRSGENVELLKGYLQRGFGSQSPVNRMVVVWASAMVPGLLTPEQQRSTIEEVLGLQQADGGWSLTSLAGTWKRRDETPLETKSDGYATGLVALVLQQPGISSGRKQLKPALAWLIENQSKTEGRWLAYSMNKNRDLSSDVGRFMSDAATAYAVLALTQGK